MKKKVLKLLQDNCILQILDWEEDEVTFQILFNGKTMVQLFHVVPRSLPVNSNLPDAIIDAIAEKADFNKPLIFATVAKLQSAITIGVTQTLRN